jgi:hypothetical protein
MRGLGSRQRVTSTRATGHAHLELTLACGHTVVRKAADGLRPSAHCGHCVLVWTEKMISQIDASRAS